MDEEGIVWEVSRGGDLYLTVGTDAYVLVSSKVMSLGSPVFAAMLESNFIEGISNHQGEGPHAIHLPDDDGDAMVLLCKIFHLDTADLTCSRPNRHMIRSLVILCDKYDCVATLRPWVALWYPLDDLTDDTTNLGEIMFIAFTLDLPKLFSLASWKVLLQQNCPFELLEGYASERDCIEPPALLGCSSPSSRTLSFLHHLGELEVRRLELHRQLLRTVEEPLQMMLVWGPCRKTKEYAYEYMQSLRDIGIWPRPSKEKHEISLADALLRLRCFNDPVFQKTADHVCDNCESMERFTRRKDKWNAQAIFFNIKKGICLDCVKTSRKSRFNGTCRESHDDGYLYSHTWEGDSYY